MPDVFISYAHQDAERAEWVTGLLERNGLSVWWDREIPPGKTWDQVIGTALDNARCVVVLWSRHSIVSDYVKDEASRAAKRGVLVPVIYDHVDSPLGFGRIEAAQFSDCEKHVNHPEVQGFVAAVGALVSSSADTGPGGQPPFPLKPAKGATAARPRRTVLLAFGVLLIGVLAGTLWWLSRGGVQELEVQIWSVEGEHKHAVIASDSFVQQNDSALAKELLDDIRRWVVSIVAPGEEPAKSLVKVHVSVPADLENQRIQLNADADIALQTHLYVVRGTGKARVVSDLNPDTLALLKEDFVIEIGAVGYRSIPIEVAWGRPIDKTVKLSAGSLRVRLAVEDFAGEENTVAQRLAHLLAKDPRLSLLGPDALERLREEISEIRKNVGFNPAIQMPVRDSLGVDYIISGTYQRR